MLTAPLIGEVPGAVGREMERRYSHHQARAAVEHYRSNGGIPTQSWHGSILSRNKPSD